MSGIARSGSVPLDPKDFVGQVHGKRIDRAREGL
jgi:hypothetical protein